MKMILLHINLSSYKQGYKNRMRYHCSPRLAITKITCTTRVVAGVQLAVQAGCPDGLRATVFDLHITPLQGERASRQQCIRSTLSTTALLTTQ